MRVIANDVDHTPAVLEARGVSRLYGRFAALKDVDLSFHAGEVHGLCGENGAGKSTFVKILGGLVAPSRGEVRVDGIALKSGQRTDPRTVSIVHQELSIIPDLSVLDNVLLGDDTLGQWLPRGRFRAEVRERLDMLGLAHVGLDQPARRLTLAERQLVEIARGVSRQARVLVLDEPTATLSDHECVEDQHDQDFNRHGDHQNPRGKLDMEMSQCGDGGVGQQDGANDLGATGARAPVRQGLRQRPARMRVGQA